MTENTSRYDNNLATRGTLLVPGLTELPFTITEHTLPGLSLGVAKQPTPFVDVPIPGDKIQYSPLELTFLIDEKLSAWIEILNWMRGLGFPQKFEQYQVKKQNRLEGVLTIQTNHLNDASVVFKFIEMFPMELSPVKYNYGDTAGSVRTASVTFAYAYFYPVVNSVEQ